MGQFVIVYHKSESICKSICKVCRERLSTCLPSFSLLYKTTNDRCTNVHMLMIGEMQNVSVNQIIWVSWYVAADRWLTIG